MKGDDPGDTELATPCELSLNISGEFAGERVAWASNGWETLFVAELEVTENDGCLIENVWQDKQVIERGGNAKNLRI